MRGRAACLILAFVCTILWAAAETPRVNVELDRPEQVMANSDLTFRISCDGASEYRYSLRLFSGGEGAVVPADPDVTEVTVSVGDEPDGFAGTLSVSANVDGVWTQERVIPLTIRNMGALDAPRFSVSSYTLAVGEPVRLEIEPVENARYYTVDIGRTDESGSVFLSYRDIRTEETSLEVDYEPFTPGVIGIRVSACAEGRSFGRSDILTLTRTESELQAPTAETDEEALAHNHGADFILRRTDADSFMYYFESHMNDVTCVDARAGVAVCYIRVPHDRYQPVSSTDTLVVRAKVGGEWTRPVRVACAVNPDDWQFVPHLAYSANGSEITSGNGIFSTSVRRGVGAEFTYAIPRNTQLPREVTLSPAQFWVKPENDFLLWDLYGTGPVWKVEQVQGEPVTFSTREYVANEGQWQELIITLDRNPSAAQDILLRIDCQWGGYSSCGYFTMRFVPLDQELSHNVPETILMRAGVEQEVHFDFDPSVSFNEGFTEAIVQFEETDFFEQSVYQFIVSQPSVMKPVRKGNVRGTVTLFNSNVSITAQTVFRIAGEDGRYEDLLPRANLILPESLKEIGDESFLNLPEGTVIRLPAGVTYVSETAFDSSVILLCRKGSPAETLCKSFGWNVLVYE